MQQHVPPALPARAHLRVRVVATLEPLLVPLPHHPRLERLHPPPRQLSQRGHVGRRDRRGEHHEAGTLERRQLRGRPAAARRHREVCKAARQAKHRQPRAARHEEDLDALHAARRTALRCQSDRRPQPLKERRRESRGGLSLRARQPTAHVERRPLPRLRRASAVSRQPHPRRQCLLGLGVQIGVGGVEAAAAVGQVGPLCVQPGEGPLVPANPAHGRLDARGFSTHPSQSRTRAEAKVGRSAAGVEPAHSASNAANREQRRAVHPSVRAKGARRPVHLSSCPPVGQSKRRAGGTGSV